jgi:hypothetical protein
MPYILREHPTLETLLQREVSNVPNPRQAAAAIRQKTAGAELLVLFKDAAGNWLIVPAGAGFELRNLGQASRARVNGKQALAYCRVTNGNSR